MPVWTSGAAKLLKRQAPMGPPPLTAEQIAYTNADEILSITGSFFAAAAIVVLLRIYVRAFMLKVFGIDDWIMLFAMVLAAVTFACFFIETYYGLGKHFIVILSDPILYLHFARVLYVHAIIVMVGISAVKVSIAFFLLRLSTRTPYSRFLYGMIAAWDIRLRPPPFGTGDAKCYSMEVFRNLGLMNSSFNIITDFLFATLPVPLIWKLQLNLRTKISLVAVLSLGYFASAAAIIKAVLQWNVLTDLDWTVHDAFNVWNYIEFTIGIIAASLPALKPLFNWFLETARAISSGGRSKVSYKRGSSLGYHKQSDNSSKSIALQSMASKAGSSPGGFKNPYHVRITTDKPGMMDKDWDMERAKKSDDSILPLQRPQPAANRIVMTREVVVS
ncbi:hypothetical protein K469DRAFT_630246 [Zopfia rhizophila CBS 207.26]|uniref:Rhodopsin domain-containing protein n=1 Tax=Zopfia rhizophila CBS 207.26 TaxID=1314779 RepID=A0A6A6E5N5_9PEZI|nr:hypothetical protein K469DRAFT_630246 [Zopfia rhizophila CBS 207.26]